MSNPEMDKSMGRASDYQSGPTGVKGASMAPAPQKDVGTAPDPKHVKSLVDGLKGLLGVSEPATMGEKNVANKGVMDALNEGIKDGTEK